MSDIYLSHSKQDSKIASQLVAAFEKQGWSVWTDRTLSTGMTWADQMDKAIRGARLIVVLWSRDSAESKWVFAEATRGLDRNNLFPIMIGDLESIPIPFNMTQTADLRDWEGDINSPKLQKVLSDIEHFLEKPKTSKSHPPKNVSDKDDDTSRTSRPADERKGSKVSLSQRLESLKVKPSLGCVRLLNLSGALAKTRRASTNGMMTTRTLFFALTGASADYGRALKKVLVDDISLDFSRVVSKAKGFKVIYKESFEPLPPGWESASDLHDLDKLVISRNFMRVLDASAEVARSMGNTERLFPEHLLAAMLIDENTRAAEILNSLNIPPKLMRSELVRALNRTKKGNALKKWGKLLNADLPNEAVIKKKAEKPDEKIVESDEIVESAEVVESPIAADTPELIAAHYAADNPDADDLIGVENEARSFARYITKSNLNTPLAIGLFGDWGSGKTFFMRKMQKFADELQEQGTNGNSLDRKSSWCENVVQIEFNAWHYIESNLWASLVEHIFSEIDAWLTKKNKVNTIEALYTVFESAQEVQREAESELKEAEGANKDAEDALKVAKSKYEKAVKNHRTLSASDIWSAITKSFLNKQDENSDLKMKVKEASTILGIDELCGSAKKLNEIVEQSGDVAGRSRLLLSSLFSRKRHTWQYIMLVSLLALAPLVVGLAWNWVSSAEQVSGIMQSIGAGVAELSALVTVIAGWGAVGLRSANKALVSLETADAELQNIIKEKEKEQRENLAEAESEVATTEERVNLAEQRVSQAVDAVDKARQRLNAETPRARLTRFLRRRLENADYAKHLGVVSMIRKDFELLSRIMTGEEWTEADQEKMKKAEVDLDKARAFERIILYVDDLDRCPADRVVEVLQAVHLLLAFPLFVVVVGVDARWVSRALSLRYRHLLGETVARDLERSPKQDSNQESEAEDPMEMSNQGRESLRVSELIASSHDYLEKIFQVPYWVKPMDKESSKEFIVKLARLSLGEEKETVPPEGAPDREDSHGTEIGQHPPSPKEDPTSKPEVQGEEFPDEEKTGKLKKDVEDKETDPKEKDVRKSAVSTTEVILGEMPLRQYEIDFMEILAPNIGRSPRRSKRFFNVYQLVRAGLSVEERQEFFGENGESLDYRIVMCLLAIVTGAPILAPQFFAEVVNWKEQGKVGLRALIVHISNDNTFSNSSEWKRLLGSLKTLKDLNEDTYVFKRVIHWSRRAMRFSFTARPI